MKIRRMFIYCLTVLLFSSCESGFEDMMDETKGEKVYKYYAYVANYNSKSVSAYSIDSTTGALTSIDSYTTLYYAKHLTTDPSNKFLYVACNAALPTPTAGYVYAYLINSSTGALTEINHYSTGASSQSVKVDPDGKYLYVANGASTWPEDKTVHVYTINPDGSLNFKITITTGTGSSSSPGAGPCSIAVNPANKFLYILGSYGLDINAYTIGDGVYGSIGTYSASPGPYGSNYPRSIVINSNGKYSYSVHGGTSGGIYAYAIDSSTGALGSLVTYYPGYVELNGIMIHPGGKFVYVTASGGSGGNILLYSVNADTGVLTYVRSTSVGYDGSTSPSVDPSGRFLYITNWNSANVSAYSIDAATGALTEISGSPFPTGSTPYSIFTMRI